MTRPNSQEIRRLLIALEDRIVGLAGFAPGFVEAAMRSKKVPAMLKKQRNTLRDELRATVASEAAAQTPTKDTSHA